MKRFYPTRDFTIYATTPTWPIHNTLLETHGVKHANLPYYDPKTKGLDFEGLCSAIEKAPERSIFMLHSCAHNPTGVDPTPEQWKQIADLIAKKHHFTFFDMAYQGFASGDLEKDNMSLRLWEERGLDFCVAQSFAKSMGLYGQRVGTFSVVCENSAEATQVTSQLATVARNTWSNPPRYGSDLAKSVLANQETYNQWLADMQLMSSRIITMRKSLVQNLKQLGNPHDWSHITNQIGMFAFTGLAKEQCQELIDKYSIYLTMNGRISVAGLNEKNIDYVARAFHEVTKDRKF